MTQRETVNQLLGVTINNELIMVNDFFDNGDGFKGATGCSFAPLYAAQIREYNTIRHLVENYDYLYNELPESEREGKTLRQWLRDFRDSALMQGSGLFIGHDDSWTWLVDEDDMKRAYGRHCKALECIGGGRMFTSEPRVWVMSELQSELQGAGYVWKEIYNEDLLAKVIAVELR